MSSVKRATGGVLGGGSGMLSDSCVLDSGVGAPNSTRAFPAFGGDATVRDEALEMEDSLSRLSALEAQHSFLDRLDPVKGLDATTAGSDMKWLFRQTLVGVSGKSRASPGASQLHEVRWALGLHWGVSKLSSDLLINFEPIRVGQ